MGAEGRTVRILVAGRRRLDRLQRGKRLAAESVRRRDRQERSGHRRLARYRRRRSSSPTASSTSAPKAASSSSSGPPRRVRRSSATSRCRSARTTTPDRSPGFRNRFSAGAAISRGRIFFVSTGGVYAHRSEDGDETYRLDGRTSPWKRDEEPAAWVQVYPTEVVSRPARSKHSMPAASTRRVASCARNLRRRGRSPA